MIFNPISGANDESPVQLMDILNEMQAWKLVPETYLIKPDSDLNLVVRDAIEQGFRMLVVCGGDGTISTVVRALVGTNVTLGIIPTGTQNNIALSLCIPKDIPAAIELLRNGRRLKIDTGLVTCNNVSTPFIEICSVGLFSSLFPFGDDIQHGKISSIGEFLSTLISFPQSEIHMVLDNKQEIHKQGHVVMISNMPYVVRHYQVGTPDSFADGLLDVLFFADLSKIDLIGYMLKGAGLSANDDSRIQHFRVRRVVIDTNPAMTIMADGVKLGEGLVCIEVIKHALPVIVGASIYEEGDSDE